MSNKDITVAMAQSKQLYKYNQVRIFFIIVFCSIFSLLFYIYMGVGRKDIISDYETIESKSAFDIEDHNGIAINVSGWFTVNGQESSRQLKKEIVLSNVSSAGPIYSYPVQYIDRPDVADFFKDNNFRRAGFSCQINSTFIKNGRYHLYMKYSYNNKKFFADLNKEIQIQ